MTVAVFGGAFDPPHLGHVALVRGALEHFGFERVLVVPAGDPPHKAVFTPAAIRAHLAELAAYGAGLDERPQIVVLNKIDLGTSPNFPLQDERIAQVIALSCATGEGVDELKRALFRLCPPRPEPGEGDELETGGLVDFLVYRPRSRRRRSFRIYRTDRGFRVVGEVMDEAELEEALAQAGARNDSVVEIVGREEGR